METSTVELMNRGMKCLTDHRGIVEAERFISVIEGKVVFKNASANALRKAQKAFERAAEELGIQGEQDIVNMVKEVRAERDVLYRCE